jgi:hypothetical protein
MCNTPCFALHRARRSVWDGAVAQSFGAAGRAAASGRNGAPLCSLQDSMLDLRCNEVGKLLLLCEFVALESAEGANRDAAPFSILRTLPCSTLKYHAVPLSILQYPS